MAQDSIIQKLREELLLPLRRESQVVYVMAEIRKYLDHRKTDQQADWRVLSFFCNWALHIKIIASIRLATFERSSLHSI
jgi:hypothetical protein